MRMRGIRKENANIYVIKDIIWNDISCNYSILLHFSYFQVLNRGNVFICHVIKILFDFTYQQWLLPYSTSCFDDVNASLEFICFGSLKSVDSSHQSEYCIGHYWGCSISKSWLYRGEQSLAPDHASNHWRLLQNFPVVDLLRDHGLEGVHYSVVRRISMTPFLCF